MTTWWLSLVTAAATANFGGTWAPVEGVNPPVNLVVTQTADRLTAGAGEDALECRLDGQPTKQKVDTVELRCAWTGDVLGIDITITTDFGDTSTQKQTWAIDAQGRLVIETTRTRQGQPVTRKSVYRRVVTVTSAR